MYIKYDPKGRITFVPSNLNKGHSVCNGCGRDMPRCWDTVCYFCNRTFCYSCSKDSNNKWYCKECFALYSKTFLGSLHLLRKAILNLLQSLFNCLMKPFKNLEDYFGS